MKALKKAESSPVDFSRVFHYSSDMMAVMDFSGKLIEVNSALVEQLGVSKKELLQVNVFEVFALSGQRSLKALAENSIEEEVVDHIQRAILPDGQVRWMAWSTSIDAEKQCVYIIGRDITEKKLYRIQANLMSKIGDLCPQINSFEEGFGNCLEMICKAIEWPIGHVYMVSQEDYNVLNPANIWYLEEPNKYKKFKKITMEKVFERGEGLPGIVAKSGKPMWLSDLLGDKHFIRVEQAQDIVVSKGFACGVYVSGELFAVLEFFTDEALSPDKPLVAMIEKVCEQLGRVIERKQVETELEFKKFSVDNHTDAIFWVSKEGAFFDTNEAACRLLGYSHDELLKLDVPAIDIDVDASAFKKLWDNLQTIDQVILNSRVKTKSGQIFPTEVTTKVMSYQGQTFMCATIRDLTEREEMLKALDKTKAQFDKTVLNVPGMVYQFLMRSSGELAFLYVSESSRRLFGLEPDAILKDVNQVIGLMSDPVSYHEMGLKSAETLEPFDWEGEVVLPSGEKKWLHGASSPVKLENGDILWDGLLMDITEKKKAEDELREQRTLYGNIVQKTPALIVGIDMEGKTTFVNPAAELATGYSALEIVGQDWWQMVYPGKEYAQVERLFEHFETGGVKDYNMLLTTKGGQKRTIAWNSLNQYDADGNIAEVIGFGADITERKKAEVERDTFFEESFDLLCIIGLDGYFKSWNPMFEKTLGYSKQEVLSMPVLDFVHPDDLEASAGHLKGLLTQGNIVVNYENRFRRKDGSYVWLVWNAQSNPSHAVVYAVAKDFSFYKEIEKEKETFIATLSHDLKTPLHAEHQVLGLLDTGTFGSINSEQHNIIRELINSNRFMYGMVDNLLTSVQYQAYEVRLNKEPTDIKYLIDSILSGDLKHLADKTLKIELNMPNNLPRVKVDPIAIKRVMYNLIHNAFQFSPVEGSIVISGKKVGHQLEISVADEGPGIKAHQRSSIFEPYSTLSAKKFKHVGTGLGLYLSKRIIEAHGGTIDFDTEVDKGTTFYFFLPLDSD